VVKLRHKGLLVLGITRDELLALREGQPLPVPLGDLHESLKGQMVLLIPGEDNGKLNDVMQKVANAYEQGATSVIEIAKSLPKGRIIQ
jgi:type II secretory pathway component PulF